ncbi:MAG: stage 0 sporulation family protein [Selenomonadaceae bacterium]|nr:stage 0 sporulation family protein [Selenomonadaceae bacterium]
MQKVIGVRFKKAGRVYYYNPGQIEIEKGEFVIVETQRGLECGHVVISPREIADDKLKIESIRRKANQQDLEQIKTNHESEKEAFKICQNKIAEHSLPMNLISVEYMFDMNKIIFSFTAEGRVDFRELVKDLASVFRTRIELRQVGVRDEAKLLGGIGCCGRPLCCASFLGDFIPVSIRMAKEQNLSLNPAKISGICGRLMCCLKYENDYYCEQCWREPNIVKEPKLSSRVVVDEGEGKIISINRQRRTATIILDNSKTVIAPWDNIFEAEQSDEEGKTIVATVGEEDNIDSEAEDKSTPSKEIKSEDLSHRNRRPQNRSNYSHQFKTNYQSQNRAAYGSQNRNDGQYRDNRNANDYNENRSRRDNRDSRSYNDNRERDNRDNRDNRRYVKRDRRNDDYQHNKRSRPRHD